MEGLKMGLLAGAAWNFPHWPVSEDIRCKDSCARFPHVGDRSSLSWRNKNNNPQNNAEQFHIWFPPAPLAWNPTQLYKCREVFTTFPCALRVNVELMCAGGCQQPSRPLLLITDMSCLNVMLEHRCTLFGRVWRTHAIPHICSISDCITQDLLTFSVITNGSCYRSNRYFTRNAFFFPFPPLRNIKKN